MLDVRATELVASELSIEDGGRDILVDQRWAVLGRVCDGIAMRLSDVLGRDLAGGIL